MVHTAIDDNALGLPPIDQIGFAECRRVTVFELALGNGVGVKLLGLPAHRVERQDLGGMPLGEWLGSSVDQREQFSCQAHGDRTGSVEPSSPPTPKR